MSVPDSFREGSFGLGAGKLRTVFRIILPSAMPGILSGIILGVGRIVGETAALMFTSGTVAQVAVNPMSLWPDPGGAHVQPVERRLGTGRPLTPLLWYC